MSKSEVWAETTGGGGPPAIDAGITALINRLAAAANRNFAAATVASLQRMLGQYDYAVAKAMVDDVTDLERVPQNIIFALGKAHKALMAKRGEGVNRNLPREEWIEAFEGWDDCDACRAPVIVVRENAARSWDCESERKYATTRHRLFYTCEECGHEESWIVAAKPVPASHPRRWDAGTTADTEANRRLKDEVKVWHRLGLVETRTNLKGMVCLPTPMSAEVWIEAGCPPSWSPVWDEINKGYPAACYEGRLVEYCNDWRLRLERGRAIRTRSAA